MKRAFTLIELLVVIAIIAILAAILFPVFAQAKEAAKATQVLSNLKNLTTSQIMYTTDTDDTLLSYITRTDMPANGIYREDIISWAYMLQPYMKNGTPRRPTSQAETGIQPQGILASPLWSQANWQRGAATPDCDNDDLSAYMPIKWFHSHFGVTFPATNGGGAGPAFGPADPSRGTPQNPHYFFAGSFLPGRPSVPASMANNFTMNLSQVSRVSETGFANDGLTAVVNNNIFLTTFGCESQFMYKGGGNMAMMDGHAKFIKGNVERYLARDAAGMWYKRFLTVDR
jgi:prepilin-type N-terminal cleavage/methylation domain-containing protein/prepilin-type processing-associated H-X9-DG protein